MQFYDVFTNYREFGKCLGYSRNPKGFYKDIRKEINHKNLMDNQLLKNSKFNFILENQKPINFIMEGAWYENHMVYYNIWPGVFDTFIKTRIDIKAELLKYAHPCFAIRLPKMEEPILSFDYQDRKAWIESLIVVGIDYEKDTRISIKIIYRVDDVECPGDIIRVVHMPKNETIEENFDMYSLICRDNEDEDYIIPASIIDACCRLTVAVIFLSTESHKVLEYDVLAKHLEAYRAIEDEHKKKEYEVKAKSKGKFGWNIGSGRGDRNLKLPRGVSYEQTALVV